MDFYSAIEQDIKDEAKDNNKYLELAKIAPTEKARKILTDIASEEKKHHEFLEEILSERKMVSSQSEKKSNTSDSELYADDKISYPSHIENAGVDPDELMD